jgi:DNA-directed RNA polymerase subunit RPC12/RpoP
MEMTMAVDLKVRCKACGEGFRSPKQMDATTFERSTTELAGKGYSCSKCGQMRMYDKIDHYIG